MASKVPSVISTSSCLIIFACIYSQLVINRMPQPKFFTYQSFGHTLSGHFVSLSLALSLSIYTTSTHLFTLSNPLPSLSSPHTYFPNTKNTLSNPLPSLSSPHTWCFFSRNRTPCRSLPRSSLLSSASASLIHTSSSSPARRNSCSS